MLDDHKYSLRRIVAYAHRDPEHPGAMYGSGGPERTYGIVTEVHRAEGDDPHWEYTLANTLTGEVRRVTEDEIFHGADQSYLDLRRRDGIPWLHQPPEAARNNEQSGFWKHTLHHFVRTAIPQIQERERQEERERVHGRDLGLATGDYVKIRGDLRPEMEPHHNLYARVISVSPSDIKHMEIPREQPDASPRKHKVLLSYHVLLEDRQETSVFDVEIKTVYTKQGRTVILNWRAAAFLAETFGDDPPYDLQFDYLNGHVFSRAEIEGMSANDLADLLARLIYVKGLLVWEELPQKAEALARSTPGFLVDQILEFSRFDMSKNRRLTQEEIERIHSDAARLSNLLN